MASPVSGQGESNPALEVEQSCPLGIIRRVPQEKFSRKPYNKSFIDQACSVKEPGYWSINTQKENLANILGNYFFSKFSFLPRHNILYEEKGNYFFFQKRTVFFFFFYEMSSFLRC